MIKANSTLETDAQNCWKLMDGILSKQTTIEFPTILYHPKKSIFWKFLECTIFSSGSSWMEQIPMVLELINGT